MTAAPWTRPHTVDRTNWPRGAWDNEPDTEHWMHGDHAVCFLRRNDRGFWCGYVVLLPGHAWYGAHYDALPDGADAEWGEIHESGTWLGWDAAHSWNSHPGRPDDGHYVTHREAKRRVSGLSMLLDTAPDDVSAMLSASVSAWERQAGIWSRDSDYERHQRAKCEKARDVAAARLLGVPA